MSSITLKEYINFINSNDIDKTIKISNMHSGCHSHLPSNHIRRKFDIFGKNSGKRMEYHQFLKNISNSEFVISTQGDRDDCYRHYECIGLGAIPVSNIDEKYKDIFEDNMLFSNEQDMEQMVNNKIVDHEYKKPNAEILTISYWLDKINKRLSENL